MKSLTNFQTTAAFCAAVILPCLLGGCAKTIEFKPSTPRTQYYHLERSVTVSMFNMSFGSNEVMKYRQDIKAVSDDRIEMDLTPMELTIVRSSTKGTNNIYGSKLLPQPDENPEVTIIRHLSGHPIHLRIQPGGNVESMSVEAPQGGKSALPPSLQGEVLNKQLQNIFINTHLMMTESILPAGDVRVGKTYKPAGKIFDKSDLVDEDLKLMMVEGIDEKGQATLTVDPRVIAGLFNDAYSNLEMNQNLPEDIAIKGEGRGRFQYDTTRRSITSGDVSLNAQAKVEGKEDLPVAVSFGLRVNIKIREIPAL